MSWTLKFWRLIHAAGKFSESFHAKSNKCSVCVCVCFSPFPSFLCHQALLFQEQSKFCMCLWAPRSRICSKLAPVLCASHGGKRSRQDKQLLSGWRWRRCLMSWPFLLLWRAKIGTAVLFACHWDGRKLSPAKGSWLIVVLCCTSRINWLVCWLVSYSWLGCWKTRWLKNSSLRCCGLVLGLIQKEKASILLG